MSLALVDLCLTVCLRGFVVHRLQQPCFVLFVLLAYFSSSLLGFM